MHPLVLVGLALLVLDSRKSTVQSAPQKPASPSGSSDIGVVSDLVKDWIEFIETHAASGGTEQPISAGSKTWM